MKRFIKDHPIYAAIICIAAMGIILLFICSSYNHFAVNNNSQINIENLSISFEKTKANVEIIINNTQQGSFQEKNTEKVYKELNTLLIEIKNAKRELLKQYQNIFDANTVTFLVTFLSALLFTVFITLFIKNMEQFDKYYKLKDELKDKTKEADQKIQKADDRITDADKKIAKIDTIIAEAKKDWTIKLQNQEYLLKIDTKRNSLIQILNLVSVLGSHLASSSYVIKPEYITLVYMIQRKAQSLIGEGFEEIKTIRHEDQTEFYRIITDSITYLNIDTLRDLNIDGLVAFEQLGTNLDIIQTMINNIPLQPE